MPHASRLRSPVQVEYAWGDASTAWGAVRMLNDTHPAPFNVSIFELGNGA